MRTSLSAAAVMSLLAGNAIAQGAVEPILFSDGIIPGAVDPTGAPETIWQTGLYRIANSPDRSRWAIRVNHTSASSNEYIIRGQGTVGEMVVHARDTEATVPSSSTPIFYISERELSINDAGELAVGGSETAAATTDTAYKVVPGQPVTIVAQEGNPSFVRPQPTLFEYPVTPSIPDPLLFNSLSVGDISNTGKVVVIDTDIDQALLWDNGSYSVLVEDDDPISVPELPGNVVTQMFSTGANLNRASAWFFENPGEDPLFGLFGATNVLSDDANFNGLTDELSTDPATLLVQDPTTGNLSTFGFEGGTIDGRSIENGLTGWLDADGNTYVTSIGGFFFPPADAFGAINGEIVADIGLPVGSDIAGEAWFNAPAGSNGSPIFLLDRRPDGAYIIGGVTNNPAVVDGINANKVIIFVAPDGTRTELVRTGDEFEVTLPDGTTQTRRIAQFNQSDATYSGYIDDTHLYFLAGTTPFAGTIPDDLFARIELPSVGTDCACDVNNDTLCTSADFFAWVSAFGSQAPECDVNNDSLCTSADFFAWVSAFGQGCD
ncbi:MAG: GC-type dockerin domain-anchored protein [Planctomycetota bacterium]